MLMLDSDATTDMAIGSTPDSRTVEQRIASGFILVDKPAGPSSHQLASWAKDLFGLERMGHGGTLDPFATGVLPLMTGKGMKLTKKILNHNKSYICVFKFQKNPDEAELDAAMARLTGRIYNVPPEISAVKVQVRTRKIFAFEKLDFADNLLVARVHCEAGTYIRTMARDLGLFLNMKVELKELRRDTSGIFTLDHCVTMQELADAVWLWKVCDNPEALLRIIHPIEKMLCDFPSAYVKDTAAAALACGAPLARPGIISIEEGLPAKREVLVKTLKEEAVCIATLAYSSEEIAGMESGEVARPSMVFLDEDVYPRRWKKSE